MANRIIGILGNILMVVEAAAFTFLVWAWFDAKRRNLQTAGVMGMREKLIELIGQAQDCGCDVTDVVEMNYVENDALADHLIANGVTIPVRCKECWKGAEGLCSYQLKNVPGKDFCGDGERM